MAYFLSGQSYMGMMAKYRAIAPSHRAGLDIVQDSAVFVAQSNIMRRGRAMEEGAPGLPKLRMVPSGPLNPVPATAARYIRVHSMPAQNRGYHNRLVTGSNLYNNQLDGMKCNE